jgi:uncharacterized protein (TIGR03435 family)
MKPRNANRLAVADRFNLTIRRESKVQPVYALVVSKHGPKLQRAKIEE